MKHTPGPWRVILPPEAHEAQHYSGTPIQYWIHGPSYAVASAWRRYPHKTDAETEANAHLIAAATTAPHDCDDPKCPGAINKRKLEAFDDLLEALKGLLWYVGQLELLVYSPEDKGEHEEVTKAKAAIAKAEGREAK